ncbi:MAG: tetratricopeptide repeat protein [Phycisphaerales bacterium]
MIQTAIDHLLGHRPQQAEAVLRRLVARNPRDAEALGFLGLALCHQARFEQAEFSMKRALALAPNQPSLHINYANLLWSLRRLDDSVAHYHTALGLRPDSVEAHIGLAAVLAAQCEYDGAIEHARRGVALGAADSGARLNLASALSGAGFIAESLRTAEESLAANPNHQDQIPNYLMTLNYDHRLSPQEVFERHRTIAPRIATCRSAPAFFFRGTLNPNRKLRVAYFSPDIRGHVVAIFLEGLLRGHDRDRFHLMGFHTGLADARTVELATLFDAFNQMESLDPVDITAAIRAQDPDILVELAGHSDGGRLFPLAARCAPVQVEYCGYPNTTGVPNVDYRLVDEWTDPAPDADALSTETLVRLPRCFLCYRPPADLPGVGEAAFVRNGHITFGSFNAAPKVNEHVLSLWAKIMQRVPGSHLVLKNRPLTSATVRERVLSVLEAGGVGRERVELVSWTAGPADHLATYNRVDIALDTLPYNGTTTTCEALLMGVPVVAMAGNSHVSRVGVSLLTAVGCPELIATDTRGYMDLAVTLAGQPERLRAYRATLRSQMLASPLCDAGSLAAAVEDRYRWMWARACDGAGPPARAEGGA